MRLQGLAIWAIAVLSPIAALAQPSQGTPATKVTEISVPALDLFNGPSGQRIGSLPKDQVKLPLDVLRVEPNKRLKIRLDGREVWIEGSAVRTNKAHGVAPCEPPPRQVTALATRGSGEGCK